MMMTSTTTIHGPYLPLGETRAQRLKREAARLGCSVARVHLMMDGTGRHAATAHPHERHWLSVREAVRLRTITWPCGNLCLPDWRQWPEGQAPVSPDGRVLTFEGPKGPGWSHRTMECHVALRGLQIGRRRAVRKCHPAEWCHRSERLPPPRSPRHVAVRP